MLLSPGEISKGMFLTVYEWESTTSEVPGEYGGTVTVQNKDRSWCGRVLKVVCVQLPYVVVNEQVCGTFPLDTRRVKLMELTEEYANSLAL